MNIPKALKVKNRLVGELNRQLAIAQRENSRRNDNPSTIDVSQVFEKINELRFKIYTLKAAIAKASSGIASELNQMQELKTFIVWLESLPTKEGEELSLPYGRNTEPVKYTWKSYINREKLDNLLSIHQKEIEVLQDHIDNYNARTEVDWHYGSKE